MQHQRTTGLTATQFTTLHTALALTQALKITLLYHRHNLTEELLAELFTVSQPTVSRAINTIERALEKILTPLNRPLGESLKAPGSLVIDGPLVPT